MTRTRAKARSGFAVLAALTALAVVAIAITALYAAVSDDARRSISQSIDAQLEQMLIAGAYDAKMHLGSAPGQSWNTDLPLELAEQGGKLQITLVTVDSKQAAIQVVAHLGKRTDSQSIHFQMRDGSWDLVDAQLD